jgi:ribosomal protein S18 acetylase RimI-like enzyme
VEDWVSDRVQEIVAAHRGERGATLRVARPDDYDTIIALVDEWWGRPIAGALQRLFLDHFFRTSLIAERTDGGLRLVGFLVGFASPADDSTAYIHFVGVDPGERGAGLGGELYEAFFEVMRARGRTEVHAVTSPVNLASIAFHRSLGFSVSDPIADYDGAGADRVLFRRSL